MRLNSAYVCLTIDCASEARERFVVNEIIVVAIVFESGVWVGTALRASPLSGTHLSVRPSLLHVASNDPVFRSTRARLPGIRRVCGLPGITLVLGCQATQLDHSG